MNVSTGFCQLFVQILARKALTRVLTFTKSGPSSPETIPKIMAPGSTSLGVISSTLTFPNLRAEAVQLLKWPWTDASNTAMKKTAIPQVKNVFQRSENFQNGLCLASSNIKRAPPIGAPKAQATPAEAPAAMNCLFL